MSENDLRQVNGIPPRMMIKAGSALMVPRAATMRADVPGHLADNGQVSFTPEIVTRRTTVRAGKRDTVASIARRYKVSTADVADWNDVKTSSKFKPGEQVVMYLPVRLAATSLARTSAKQPISLATVRSAKAGAPARKGGTPSKRKR
jgi:membrane-bound lytic murein transglycosylase D